MTKLSQTMRERAAVAAAMVLVLAAALAGCASTDSSSGPDKTMTAGIIPGWPEQIASMYLCKVILESKGYTFTIKELNDIAPIYAGAAKGDIDVFAGAPERIQKPFWDQYKNKLEDVGSFYDNSYVFLAVPDYVRDVQSISDLPSRASEFDGKIIGIEPGAGMTKLTQEDVFPSYGLGDSFKLVVSSTAAMLAELKKATDARQPIVVSLWQPFWANAAFPVRPLEDPKGAFGPREGVHFVTRQGFSEDHPDVAAMMSHLKLTDQQYASLQDYIVNKYGQGHEEEAVKAWLDQNPDFAPALEKYLNS